MYIRFWILFLEKRQCSTNRSFVYIWLVKIPNSSNHVRSNKTFFAKSCFDEKNDNKSFPFVQCSWLIMSSNSEIMFLLLAKVTSHPWSEVFRIDNEAETILITFQATFFCPSSNVIVCTKVCSTGKRKGLFVGYLEKAVEWNSIFKFQFALPVLSFI